jgi:hypothetical protein
MARGCIDNDDHLLFSINVATIADPDHEYRQSVILDGGDEAVIAYPVFPEVTESRAFERFADTPWVIQHRQAFPQESRMRCAMGLSSLANSLTAAASSSIRQAKLALHGVQGMRLAPTGPQVL